MTDNELITARELAKSLNLSVDTIWRYTRENRIPFVELGSKQYRYNLKSVMSSLTSPNVVKEQSAEYMLKQDGQYTYQDYLEMPDEPGFRLEILDGHLVKEPAPNIIHQSIIGKLYLMLHGFFEKFDPEGYVFLSPLDVTLRDISVVQPDLIYIADDKSDYIEKNRVDGPPTLAVEVSSPSSRRKDRLQKLQIYQREGVEHYFIVSPEDKSLECYQLREGLYSLVASGMDDDVVCHPVFTGLDIPLGPLWKKPYKE
ncbi:Uma2 family endonuclease [Bacillota bacterium]